VHTAGSSSDITSFRRLDPENKDTKTLRKFWNFLPKTAHNFTEELYMQQHRSESLKYAILTLHQQIKTVPVGCLKIPLFYPTLKHLQNKLQNKSFQQMQPIIYIFIVYVTSHPTCFGPLLAHHQGCPELLVYATIWFMQCCCLSVHPRTVALSY
jgi:hypothetical protein